MKLYLWLNLDAPLEVEDPVGYRCSSRMQAQIASLAQRLLRRPQRGPWHLLGGQEVELDFLVPGAVEKGIVPGSRALPWCPTPSALSALRARGLEVGSVPSLDVLRSVLSRRFHAELGATLEGECFVTTPDALREALAHDEGRTWILKRAYSFAGRGRKLVQPRAIDEGTQRWIAASFASGGLQVEPKVEVECEFSLHGYVLEGGGQRLFDARVLEVDDRGAWLATRDALGHELAAHEREALVREGSRCALALASAGYHGPFGIDAFRWRDATGASQFRARSEVNPRFTMGFF
ncbi:MAG TPA: hypothetical protein PKE00_04640 [Planctomycetota bacterium]|nr:hypothetical protein [Planctomycetota bacterium]